MPIQVFREQSKYHAKVFDFFDFNKLDAFHCQEVLSVIYGNEWESILIVDEDRAFLHTFVKQKIKDTSWYDIEPFLGYSGPVVNTDDSIFINSALKIYSQLCREEQIIAEIIRFNPLLQNHQFFQTSNELKIFPAKEIVIVNCFEDESRQIQEFKSSTRRNLKNHALQHYSFQIHARPEHLSSFLDIYYKFMNDIEAKKEWLFSTEFFKRTENSSYLKLAEVYDKDGICSTSIVIEHNLASYYFLGANRLPRLKGAHELLLLGISVDAAKNGIPKLILGGGNSASPDDSLLIYKKKFAKESQTFYMGKLIHNQEIFRELSDKAIAQKPEIANLNFFLKYRL